MRRWILITLLLGPAAGCSATPGAAPQEVRESRTNVSVLVGGRFFNDDDWDPVDDQVPVALEVDWHEPADGLGIELGVSYSSDDDSKGGNDVDSDFLEFYVGPRVTWGAGRRLHPFIAGGLSVINADVDVDGPIQDESEDDTSLGAYGHLGFYFDLTRNLILGLDGRALLFTDIDVPGGADDADYLQLAVIIGYTF